jgi:hypothetical protein
VYLGTYKLWNTEEKYKCFEEDVMYTVVMKGKMGLNTTLAMYTVCDMIQVFNTWKKDSPTEPGTTEPRIGFLSE